MKKIMIFLAAVSSLFALSSNAYSQDKATATYSNISDSSYIAGPKITPSDMEGKVVFFEYWGLKCGPCIASMPHLQELWEKYGKTGKFMMIGSHCQGRDDAGIKKILANAKVSFPIYQHIYVSLDRPKGGIPFAVLIDHNGELVKSGHPSELYKLVPDLVKKAPELHPVFGKFEIKQNKALIKSFMPGKNMESAFAALEKKSKEDNPAGKEASEMLEKANVWKTRQVEFVEEAIKSTPSCAVEKIASYKLSFPSDTQFNDKLAELKTNKNVMLVASIRKSMESDEAAYRKKPKPSKMTSKKFATLKSRLENIDDPLLAEEIKSLSDALDSLARETAP